MANPFGMDIRDMVGELNRQRLRDRELREQNEQKDAQASQSARDTEMAMLTADAQDLKFDAMKKAGVTPINMAGTGTTREQPVQLPSSGILPGEEQVTTQDTHGMLSKMTQDGLRKKYEQSQPTKDYDSWLYDQYGQLAPEERVKAMRAAGLADSIASRKATVLARENINRNARMAAPDDRWDSRRRAGLMQVAQSNSPLDAMRQLQQEELALQEASRWDRVADNNRNRAVTQAMANPRVAPGLFNRSVQNAATPFDLAKVQEGAGNRAGARDAMDLAGQQMRADADVRAAQVAADAARPQPPVPLANQMAPELDAALATQDPAQRRLAVMKVVSGMNKDWPADAVEKEATRILMSHLGRTAPLDPQYQAMLNTLRRDKPKFIERVMTDMGLTRDQAELMYNNAGGVDSFGQSVGKGLAATGSFLRNLPGEIVKGAFGVQ